MDRLDYLKPSRFGNIEKRRLLDSKNLKEKRSVRRTTNFNQRRDIDNIAQEIKENIKNTLPKKDSVIDRKLALQKFKAEKEAKKKALKEKKKPPFIVGIPHHGSSPLLKDVIAECNSKKASKATFAQEVRNMPTRVTRATTRNVQALKEKPKINGQPENPNFFKAPPSVKVFPFKDNKSVFTFQPHKAPQSTKKLTSPHTPTVLKRSVTKKPLNNVSNLVNKIKPSPKNSHEYTYDEVLAAPLPNSNEIDGIDRQEETVRGYEERQIEIPKKLSTSLRGKRDTKKVEESEDAEDTSKGEDIDPELAGHAQSQHSNLKAKLRKNSRKSHLQDSDEVLPAHQLVKEEIEEKRGQEEAAVTVTQKNNEKPENVSSQLTEVGEVMKVEQNDDDRINNRAENNECDNQVLFQNSRVDTETTRLLEQADHWETVVLRESLPQEVMDEVACVAGQTRLLTNDKFQQYRRLIVQFEKKTGSHPVTLDDLNGFWDMVYLQVESLDKKYAALEELRKNNWVNPEPPSKKKRRATNKSTVKKSTVYEKPPNLNSSQLPEAQPVQTPTTNVIPAVSSVILNRKRTRSNSPSPYIAMRLSGIGRNNVVIESSETAGTPKSGSCNSAEAHETPKSALKKRLTGLSDSARRQKSLLSKMILENTEESVKEEVPHLIVTEQLTVPTFTPRRSTRLMTKLVTPAKCTACDSVGCDRSKCMIQRSSKSSVHSQKRVVSPMEDLQETVLTSSTKPDITKDSASKSTRCYKKVLTFSPSESKENSDSATVKESTKTKEADINMPRSSGVRFSLRPSILTTNENNETNIIANKSTKRRQATLFTGSATAADHDSEASTLVRAKSRRSIRQSRKVTFESGAEEKPSFKLPATPYRKIHVDS